jgi:hypothetical protein
MINHFQFIAMISLSAPAEANALVDVHARITNAEITR